MRNRPERLASSSSGGPSSAAGANSVFERYFFVRCLARVFHRDPYPILDFRALWSVSLDTPKQYSFDFWWPYVEFCRGVAGSAGVDLRTLDRALWQYSHENQ
jgi:hypothetical protein